MYDNQLPKWTCSRVEQHFEDYIDGSLSAEEEVALKEHLRQCATCGEFNKFLAGVREMLDSPAETIEVEPRPVVRRKVMQYYRQELAARVSGFAGLGTDQPWILRLLNYRLPAFPTLAAVGLAAFLVFFILKGGTVDNPAERFSPAAIQLADTTYLFDSLTVESTDHVARSLRKDSLLMQFMRPAEWSFR